MADNDMGDAMDNDLAGRPGGEGGSAGQRLRAAREARRLGVDKVARELHLSAGIIGALERDDYASLPPPAFVRGYLRNYARLLDLPEQEIVDAYNRVAGEEAGPELRPAVRGQGEAKPASWLGPLGLVLLGIAGIWGYQYWRSFQTSSGAPAPASSPMAAVEAPGSPTVPPYPSAQPEPSPAPPQPEVDTLTLSFSGESWASVIDAEGKRLLFQTVAKDQVKTVQGKAPFKITLGRPADTRLEYNGRAYDHGYTSNRSSVRFSVPRASGQ
ncbi:helix-turn-helix domain-containing protein [Methylococcus sp. ANG]|uniref:helix-turn-helix domain-containing protein n=1 Tax=Methylococcus sp. ANG TaxID=3231903 RepID=UPI00345AC745